MEPTQPMVRGDDFLSFHPATGAVRREMWGIHGSRARFLLRMSDLTPSIGAEVMQS